MREGWEGGREMRALKQHQLQWWWTFLRFLQWRRSLKRLPPSLPLPLLLLPLLLLLLPPLLLLLLLLRLLLQLLLLLLLQ